MNEKVGIILTNILYMYLKKCTSLLIAIIQCE